MTAPVVQSLCERFSQYIYGVDVGDLQTAAVRALTEKGLKAACAESCTGGYVSKRLTDVPGCSAVFDCGVTSYANEIKERVLGVARETLARYGAVSEQTAREMAGGWPGLISAFRQPASPDPAAAPKKSRWGWCTWR